MGFHTQTLAYMLDSLVRVSRRVTPFLFHNTKDWRLPAISTDRIKALSVCTGNTVSNLLPQTNYPTHTPWRVRIPTFALHIQQYSKKYLYAPKQPKLLREPGTISYLPAGCMGAEHRPPAFTLCQQVVRSEKTFLGVLKPGSLTPRCTDSFIFKVAVCFSHNNFKCF